jgi:hypothetical protein
MAVGERICCTRGGDDSEEEERYKQGRKERTKTAPSTTLPLDFASNILEAEAG